MTRRGPDLALAAGLWLALAPAGGARAAEVAGPAPVAPKAASTGESRRAFLLERLLEVARLEKLEARTELGAPLTGVRRNLQAAELVLAEADDAQAALRSKTSAAGRAQESERVVRAFARFDALRAEIVAQMDYIEALLSRTELEQALVQAEAQLEQSQAVLAEAEAKARLAEAAARQETPDAARQETPDAARQETPDAARQETPDAAPVTPK